MFRIFIIILLYALYQLAWYFPKLFRFFFFKDSTVTVPITQKIAHRGSRLEGLPENSMAAFEDSLKNNTDVIECDVWLTADGEVVIHHDEDLQRMTRRQQRVCEATYDTLPKLSLEILSQCERVKEHRREACEDIPRLQELFALLPADKAIIIEFKQDSWELIQKVHNLILQHRLQRQVLWFSLDEGINAKLRRHDSALPTIASIPAMLRILACYYLGILPFVNIPDAVYGITVEEITLETIREEQAIASFPDLVKQILAYALQGRPPYAMLTPKLFLHLRRRGVPVLFLGVNSESDLQLAVSAGATGVLTDRIQWLNSTMQANPQAYQFKRLYE